MNSTLINPLDRYNRIEYISIKQVYHLILNFSITFTFKGLETLA